MKAITVFVLIGSISVVAGCTTVQPTPPPRTVTATWNGITVSYTLADPPLAK